MHHPIMGALAALLLMAGLDAGEASPVCPGATRQGRDAIGPYADVEVKGQVQRFRWIAPGKFAMGSPANEPGRFADEAQHQVTITRGFWLADSECTQGFWRGDRQ